MYKLLVRIGVTIWLLPRFIIQYWILTCICLAPFACMALYYRAWTPYLWWWGATALGTVAFGGLTIKLRYWSVE